MTELYLSQTIPGRNSTRLRQAATTSQPLQTLKGGKVWFYHNWRKINRADKFLPRPGKNFSMLVCPLDTYHFHQNYIKTARYAFPFSSILIIHTYRCPFLLFGKYLKGAGWTWALPTAKVKREDLQTVGVMLSQLNQALQDLDNQGKLTQRLISLPKAMLKFQIWCVSTALWALL